MSLYIFRNEKELNNHNSNIHIKHRNDAFFDSQTILQNSPLEQEILKDIDKATYVDAVSVHCRNSDKLIYPKDVLSTGTKTLLNILNHKDICFDVVECGNNALKYIPRFHNGYILWETPILAYSGSAECDIVFDDKHFIDFYEYMKYVMEGV